MKKVILSLGVVLLSAGVSMAQDKHNHDHAAHAAVPVQAMTATPAPVEKSTNAAKPAATPTPAAAASSLKPENMDFKTDAHDFGTIPEGPNAEFEFVFKNTGKEPIILQQVHASCGCTTPSYSKDPVLPGKTGTVKASYATAGRPNAFTKTITVLSNAGTKVLTIKGTVEPAPTSSVPENNSMLKTH